MNILFDPYNLVATIFHGTLNPEIRTLGGKVMELCTQVQCDKAECISNSESAAEIPEVLGELFNMVGPDPRSVALHEIALGTKAALYSSSSSSLESPVRPLATTVDLM
jgi:hypothetical protein